MKLVLGIVIMLTATSTWAQLAPPRNAEKGSGVVQPLDKAPPAAAPPQAVPPQAQQPSNADLAELLRKQTAAIMALHSQLVELEGRVGRLEQGAH